MDEPLSPDKIRQTVQYYAAKKEPTEFNPRKWGAMIGWLEKYLVSTDNRKLVLGWLFAFPGQDFKPISSTTLTPQQKNGIARWVGTTKNEDTDEWEPRSTFQSECLAILNASRYDYHAINPDAHEAYIVDNGGELAGVVTAYLEDAEDPCWNEQENSEPKTVTGVAV